MRDWTEEERAKQGELIKTWKPWKQSTGAKTKTGKKYDKQKIFEFNHYEYSQER